MYGSDTVQLRLQDITNAVTLGLSESALQLAVGGYSTVAPEGFCRFTLAAPANVELQYRCSASQALTSGLGYPQTWGTNIYSTVELLQE
jgi:hypothetical protein